MTTSERIQALAGWAQYPQRESPVVRPERYRLLNEIASTGTVIARGCGRSYGDAALDGGGRVVDMCRLDRILEFDAVNGILHAEAGLTLRSLIEHLLPQGWFPYVTPGTRQVTLGGCIASNVHGKNHHHDGDFSNFIDEFSLINAHGQEHWVGPSHDPGIFHATTGGMGLTGIIGEVKMRLRRVESAYVETQHHTAQDLRQLMALLENQEYDDDYTVAWIDCMRDGRGILMRGHHASRDRLPGKIRKKALHLSTHHTGHIPITLPRGILNPRTVGLFNSLYFHLNQRSPLQGLCDYRQFFYPLDRLGEWYRLYGRGGFVQYQCVLPDGSALPGLEILLGHIRSANLSPFLAVLKRMGPESAAPLGFALKGYTLAMDLPLYGEAAQRLCAELDAITLAHNGRVYLAKDACLDRSRFRHMYPRYPAWLQVKRSIDPENRFASALSQRLDIPND